MPTYDYVCEYCKSTEEITHTVAQCDWKFRCVRCGLDMKRVVSAPGVELKGPCWSKDGYTHPKDFLNKC